MVRPVVHIRPVRSLVKCAAVVAELLEDRRLLSGSAFTNVDVTRTAGNEAEGAIAVDPTDPSRLFAMANTDPNQFGLHAARSNDGGATWIDAPIADGNDALTEACCDPSCAFDGFGNLFISYISLAKSSHVLVAMSTDGGATFKQVTELRGHDDQPTLTVGAGSLWVTFARSGTAVATGAPVTGLGQVGAFGAIQAIPGAGGGTFGDIAIGPNGEVAVTYEKPKSGGYAMIGVNIDPDGLGPAGFGRRVNVTTTGVGLFAAIDAQSSRGIDAEAGLAYDRSAGPFRGRVYLLYSDAAPGDSNLVDVFVRYSDNGGLTWSAPGRINDDSGLTSHFLPRIASDDTTGDVAVSWYDTRDDPGNALLASTTPAAASGAASASGLTQRRTRHVSRRESDDAPDHGKAGLFGDARAPHRVTPESFANDDAGVYAALVRPTTTGLLVSPNVRISAGLSNAFNADNQIDLGDYTGLAFHAGILHPLWADNSNAALHNPDGAGKTLDQYTAAVNVSGMPAPDRATLGGLAVVPGPAAMLVTKGYSLAKPTGTFAFPVTYTAAPGIDTATITGAELTITGPGGFSQQPHVLKVKPVRGANARSVTYIVQNPSGRWTPAQSGVYTIAFNGTVKDLAGNIGPNGPIGYFAVIA